MKILEIQTEKRLLGNLGERAAAKYLKKNGYKIAKRNFVAEGHEIDLIAETRDTVVFVEVKTRTIGTSTAYESRPAAAVTPEKQRGIIKAAQIYAAFNPRGKKLRFDIVEVYVLTKDNRKTVAEIKHLISAFNKNTAYPAHHGW